VPWRTALGDGACSNVGAGCARSDRTALMIGTSGAMRVIWRTERFAIPSGAWCYRLDAKRIVLGGALNDGGRLIAWLRDAFKLPPLREAEAQAAAMPPDSHGLTVLPFWGGERSPHWAADAQGAIVGLRLHNTPVDVLRAALEAVALRFGEMDRVLGEAIQEREDVVATGGALLQAPVWQQIIADVLGRTVKVSTEREASSRGAVLAASEALGLLRGTLEDQEPRVRHEVRPNPGALALYKAAASRQRALYEALVTQGIGAD
jgi:gluconokinase